MTESEVRAALRGWVRDRSPDAVTEVTDDTPLISSRIITSLQVTDLLLLIEELRNAPIDPAALRPGVFRDIDTIYATFFAGDA
ncbi:MAG TPA: hypothetical protein VNA12_09830 [Mycobacteriales bacterium]|nr:hypothetical protein [Mycobacteriales bacterium]